MSANKTDRVDFLDKATEIIVKNVSNERFGVSELAEELHISRSNLLRKIKSATNLSASQFIRKVRLEMAMDMLKDTSLTVSEISYKVGFGSSSYFIKCFREQYGYPPGEAGKQEAGTPKPEEQVEEAFETSARKSRLFSNPILILAISALVVAAISFLIFYDRPLEQELNLQPEKSIAVLPFKNESSDSSNLYFVNGLMESTLNNLQKIKNLRVLSRSSVEKYRNSVKTIPEIAQELNVSYLVEGSGQKVGDQVLLNIQLIDASGDKHLWAEQYNREVVDIFAIQNEVATKIAKSVKAIVTPAELRQIQKQPTENMLAYDYYLQGLDPFLSRTREGLEEAIDLFKKAIDEDQEFALAYANVAISYYLLEMFQTEKQYTEEINSYSDKALLYDSKSAESLTAKAFYYIQTGEYTLALPYLEKALEYNPNSSLAIQMLADFYFRLTPNTEKYLQYALRGTQIDAMGNDSVTKSYAYVQLSNALVSSGFIDEALKYTNMSLDYNPTNYYAPHLKAFILFAKDGNVNRTQKLLNREWKKDTTRLDILQDLAKMFYLKEDYDSAYYYFQKFVEGREKRGLDIYKQEDAKIAMVYEKVGQKEEAKKYFKSFSEYCEKDQSVYRNANLAVKFAYEGKKEEAIEQLKIFSGTDNYPYWFLMIEQDPLFKNLKNNPEFKITVAKIKRRFWREHERMSLALESGGLL
ncbi:helix-turn-helix domain-containing protein [Salinimicrobium sp. MT39]|uniref:Helix-turn-helix domain-containing protein n=1 Tax=Salinimicrobium profundisediminis TaxID=2994553 RepID=A0A9X3CTI2_9FLAO|nr:helix-turn-helix domain-containing protein [Salinimicrobium profundisediminis]MCX2836522.1 helix-turn-helix domain-containing protein [Salinimicrobium profundisediminis]